LSTVTVKGVETPETSGANIPLALGNQTQHGLESTIRKDVGATGFAFLPPAYQMPRKQTVGISTRSIPMSKVFFSFALFCKANQIDMSDAIINIIIAANKR